MYPDLGRERPNLEGIRGKLEAPAAMENFERVVRLCLALPLPLPPTKSASRPLFPFSPPDAPFLPSIAAFIPSYVSPFPPAPSRRR